METRNYIRAKFEPFAVAVLAMLISVMAFAQTGTGAPDLKVDVTTSKATSTEEWFTNPLYWIIGALLLIVIIALIARGNGNRN